MIKDIIIQSCAGPFGRGGSGDNARRALQQSPISQVLASQFQSA